MTMTDPDPKTTAGAAPAWLNFADVLRAIQAAAADGLPVRQLLNAAMSANPEVGAVDERYPLCEPLLSPLKSVARDASLSRAATARMAADRAAAARHGLHMLELPTEWIDEDFDECDGRGTAILRYRF